MADAPKTDGDDAPTQPVEEHGTPPRSRGAALIKWGKLAAQILIPLGVVALVWHEFHTIRWGQVRLTLQDSSSRHIAFGIAGAAFTLAAMGLYDAVAFASTESLGALHRWRLGLLFFAWTNFLTLGPIGGPALRLFFYRKAGMETSEIVRGLARMYVGIFGGLGAFAAVSLIHTSPGPGWLVLRLAGACALSFVLVHGYRLGSQKIPWLAGKSGGMSTRQASLLALAAALDWMGIAFTFIMAARAIRIELEPDILARTNYIGYVVGIASMVPGGLGSADSVWLKFEQLGRIPAESAAAHIVMFRLIFYILPWLASMLLMYIMFAGRSEVALKWQRRILATTMMLNALWLLASAAWRPLHPLKALEGFAVLDTVEASHAVGLVAAAIMLFLSRGLLRGYRAAWITALVALAMAAAAHAIKGRDYEEIISCTVLLLLLAGARPAFERKGRVPIGWELTMAAAVGSFGFFLIVGLSVNHRFGFGAEAWTNFVNTAHGSRVVRGGLLLLAVGLAAVLRQALKPEKLTVLPSREEIAKATAFIAANSQCATTLSLSCGDKGIWWFKHSDTGPSGGEPIGLALYQRRDDKLIIFCDPLLASKPAKSSKGKTERAGAEASLIKALDAYSDEEDVDLLFYQISGRWMEHLHDFGFSFFKLGEEALVDVRTFTLEGGNNSNFRKTIRKVEEAGVRYDVLMPPHSDETISRLRHVSDAWLAAKGAKEMQFSIGYFSPWYLQAGPLAVAKDKSGKIIAFLNLLAVKSAEGGEVTFDFMRYCDGDSTDAPPAPQSGDPASGEPAEGGGVSGLMEFMILQTLKWSHEQGYARVSLGMSPLYDVGQYRSSTPTERMAKLLFEHGERIYNYRGLHRFKDKFRPIWEPRYLAYQKPWDWVSAVLATTSLIKATRREDRMRISEAREGRAVASE